MCISRKINHRVIKVLLFFTLLEVAVAVYEYAIGVKFLFAGQDLGLGTHGRDLLYYNHTFGLSNNSSVLGQKIFAGMLLLFAYWPSRVSVDVFPCKW